MVVLEATSVSFVTSKLFACTRTTFRTVQRVSADGIHFPSPIQCRISVAFSILSAPSGSCLAVSPPKSVSPRVHVCIHCERSSASPIELCPFCQSLALQYVRSGVGSPSNILSSLCLLSGCLFGVSKAYLLGVLGAIREWASAPLKTSYRPDDGFSPPIFIQGEMVI